MSNITFSMTPKELEALVRRVVREEIIRALRYSRSILADQRHEGPDNPEEDQSLLQESILLLADASDQPETWTNWEDYEAELDRAEAAGELPD